MSRKKTYEEWIEDLDAVPDKKEFIKRSLEKKEHLHIFGRYFFPDTIKGNKPVPEIHIDLLREISKDDHSAAIIPRSFAKSTWMKIDLIHDIVYNKEPVILWISVTKTEAQRQFEDMKSQLESNTLLKDVYGNLVPDRSEQSTKWTNSHFETTNGVNVVATGANKGRGVNIKGQRPTKIVCDDIEEDEQVNSPTRREKLHNWLYSVILPSLDKKKGKIKMIGTVLHEQCEILKFYDKFGGIKRKAIEDGESIWPNYWSLEDLKEKKRQLGSRIFSQEYMNEPLSYENANFPEDWITENYFVSLPENKARTRHILYIDPQAGESDKADEFCITKLAYHKNDPNRYAVKQIAGRKTQLTQAKMLIVQWIDTENVERVIVEKVLNQTAVWQHCREWKNGKLDLGLDCRKRNIPLKAVSPADSKAKRKDKLGRLQYLEPMFERGEIHIRPEMTTLKNQLLFLGSDKIDHDDRADSLIGAIEASYEYSGSQDDIIDTNEDQKTIGGNLRRAKF